MNLVKIIIIFFYLISFQNSIANTTKKLFKTSLIYEDFSVIKIGKTVFFANETILIFKNLSIFDCSYKNSFLVKKLDINDKKLLDFYNTNLMNLKNKIKNQEFVKLLKIIKNASSQNVFVNDKILKSLFQSALKNNCFQKYSINLKNKNKIRHYYFENLLPLVKVEIFLKSRYKTIEQTSRKENIDIEWRNFLKTIYNTEKHTFLYY